MKAFTLEKAKRKNNIRIRYDVYRMTAPERIKYGAVGLALGSLVCWLCYHSIYSAPLAAAVMLIYISAKKKSLKEERKKRLLYHFKDFLGALHTALNSGYSVENGTAEALEDIRSLHGDNDVMTFEIRYMLSGLRLGRQIDEMFEELAQRSGVEDIRLFSELLSIGKRRGGRLGKILGDTKHIICGKIETEQEIDRQLSSKKYEQKIMSLMPACIIIYLRLTFDGFIEQLYGNLLGVIIMTVCLGVYVCAYCMGRKIADIKV